MYLKVVSVHNLYFDLLAVPAIKRFIRLYKGTAFAVNLQFFTCK